MIFFVTAKQKKPTKIHEEERCLRSTCCIWGFVSWTKIILKPWPFFSVCSKSYADPAKAANRARITESENLRVTKSASLKRKKRKLEKYLGTKMNTVSAYHFCSADPMRPQSKTSWCLVTFFWEAWSDGAEQTDPSHSYPCLNIFKSEDGEMSVYKQQYVRTFHSPLRQIIRCHFCFGLFQ